jgi:hypothetical protein
MAKSGLSFEDPMYLASGGVPVGLANPYAGVNPVSTPGLSGLQQGVADIATMGAAARGQLDMGSIQAPPAQGDSNIFFDQARRKFYVNGVEIDEADDSRILASEALLGRPSVGAPQGSGWTPISTQLYAQFIQDIKQPSLGTLAARNFGRGVDNAQMLFGRGLQLAGAEETGGRIVAQQEQDLARTAPFERQFTDIESGREAVEWLVASFAQQGPNLIESIITMGLGFLAGTAAGGPLAGVGGAMAGLLGKATFKQSVIAAARKKAAGEVLDPAEEKVLRAAAGLAGAVTASYAQNLTTGASDIYGELREQGANADDVEARIKALAGSVPYAALDTLSEYAFATLALRGGTRVALPAGATRIQQAGEYLRRGAVGLGAGGTLEGTTEMGQESLLLGLSGQDFSSPENVNRLINSFAAGFAVGGPISAVANLRSNTPENLLSPAQPTEPIPGVQPPGPNRGSQGELFPVSGAGLTPGIQQGMQGELFPGASMQQPGVPGAAPPTAPTAGGVQGELFPSEPAQRDMFEQQATADRIRAGIIPAIPAAAPGQQGVLNLFADTGITAQELNTRMQPPGGPLPPAAPTPVMVPDARQGALQFSGPAPAAGPVNTQMANQLQTIQDRLRRQREFEQVQAQQAALIQQQTEALAQQSQNARDIYTMQQQQGMQASQMSSGLPMRQAGPTQPQQLPLFTRRQAPVPPRAGQLRRGGRMAARPQSEGADRGIRQASTQLPMFTLEGEPTLPALRAAGGKSKVTRPTPKPRATTTPGARGLKKGAKVAEITVKETPSAVQKPVPAPVSARKQPEAGKGVGAEVPAKREAAGKGEALKAKAATDAQRSAVLAETVRKGELVQAGREWSQYADPKTQPKWSELTPAQQEKWRKVAIEDRKPSMAAAEEIAPPKTEEPKPPKALAALAAPASAPAPAPSAKVDGPVALNLELADGSKLNVKDGQKLLTKLDRDIKKFEDLLVCLRPSR